VIHLNSRIVFRVDSSTAIGAGHVMRCLSLARYYRQQGLEVLFICRQLPGSLINHIESSGFCVKRLPLRAQATVSASNRSDDEWLGIDYQTEIDESKAIISTLAPQWVVVDSYGIDKAWHNEVIKMGVKLLVIDDLANRSLRGNIVLNQNLAPNIKHRYQSLIGQQTTLLLGPSYSLLRQEFRKLYVRLKPFNERLNNPVLTIAFGGSDVVNETIKALKAALKVADNKTIINVIVGQHYPHYEQLCADYKEIKHLNILKQINNVAQILMNSTIAIGAVGTMTWERCCLGIPSIVATIADNQREVAYHLASLGYHDYVGHFDETTTQHYERALSRLLNSSNQMINQHQLLTNTVDGNGVERVYNAMVNYNEK